MLRTTVRIKTDTQDSILFFAARRDLPDYVEVDYKDMKARFLRGPKMEDVPYPVQMEPNLVIEFYSR